MSPLLIVVSTPPGVSRLVWAPSSIPAGRGSARARYRAADESPHSAKVPAATAPATRQSQRAATYSQIVAARVTTEEATPTVRSGVLECSSAASHREKMKLTLVLLVA